MQQEIAGASEPRTKTPEVRVLQQALTDFELSDRSTERGSALDRIAYLAASGNVPAVRELVRIVLEMQIVQHAVRSVLLDPDDVDDAIQATLIILATRIETFNGESSFKTWVSHIARNQAVAVVRRNQRMFEPSTNEIVPDHDNSARRLSSLVAEKNLVDQAIGSLSDEHREVLHLREDLNLSYDDISDHLGISVGTVNSRISRARLLLAQRLVVTDPDRHTANHT